MNLAKVIKMAGKARLPSWPSERFIEYHGDFDVFRDQDREEVVLSPEEIINQKWEVWTGAIECRHAPPKDAVLDEEFKTTCAQCHMPIQPARWVVC